jgi:hypothetical protein
MGKVDENTSRKKLIDVQMTSSWVKLTIFLVKLRIPRQRWLGADRLVFTSFSAMTFGFL